MDKYKQVFIKNFNNTLCNTKYKYIVYGGTVYTVSSMIQGMSTVLHGEGNPFVREFLNSVAQRGSVFVSDDGSGETFSIMYINTRTKKPGTRKIN